MPRRLRNVFLSMTAMALTGLAGAQAQQAQTKTAPGRGTGGAPAGGTGGIRGEIPGQNDVLATVVDGKLDGYGDQGRPDPVSVPLSDSRG